MAHISDLALEAILNEWHPQEYDPPHTDIREWTHSLETLCDTYGIPDTQRPQCATAFVKDGLRAGLLEVLADARTRFGPVHWDRFKIFIVAFDQALREQWESLPFYKKHPKYTGAALGIAGSAMLWPLGAAGILWPAGFASGGIVGGSIAATIQSIVYGGATGGLFSLLQSAGATLVLPSVGTILTGAATTGAGVIVARQPGTSTNELLHQAAETIVPGQGDGDDDDDDDDGPNPPPDPADAPEEYVFTPQAVLAIAKSWDVGTYNPPGTDCTSWLRKIRNLCERYGIPVSQRALCATHHMRVDCKEAANAAECYNMTWDAFTVWIHRYDREYRRSTNRRAAELSMNARVANVRTRPY